MSECKYHLCFNEANYGSKNFCSFKCKSKYNVRKTRYNNKIKAVEYMGGKCNRCEFDSHPAAMHFHHYGEKNFGLSAGTGFARSWEKIKAELDICEMICANCHAIEHYKNENLVV